MLPAREILEQELLLACHAGGWGMLDALILVSGGVDSMVLLSICTGLMKRSVSLGGTGLKHLHVLHVQYDLRTDAAADAELVRKFCEHNGLAYRERHCDLLAMRAERGESRNVQGMARRFRYDAAREIASEEGLDVIMTGHHSDDLVETMVWKLSEDKSLLGLSHPRVHEGDLLRPFLGVRKDTLLSFAATEGICYREDTTNRSLGYRRNRLRHRVLPALRLELPHLETSLVTLHHRLATTLDLQEKLLAETGIARRFGRVIVLSETFFDKQRITYEEKCTILHHMLRLAYGERRFSRGEIIAVAAKIQGSKGTKELFRYAGLGRVTFSRLIIAPIIKSQIRIENRAGEAAVLAKNRLGECEQELGIDERVFFSHGMLEGGESRVNARDGLSLFTTLDFLVQAEHYDGMRLRLCRLGGSDMKKEYIFRGFRHTLKKIFGMLKIPRHCIEDSWELRGGYGRSKKGEVLGVFSPYAWFLELNGHVLSGQREFFLFSCDDFWKRRQQEAVSPEKTNTLEWKKVHLKALAYQIAKGNVG